MQALTAAPSALLKLLDGLKHVVEAVVPCGYESDRDRESQNNRGTSDEIEGWEDVDGDEIREEMQREKLRMMLGAQRAERPRKRVVRHWDDEYSSDEVIEVS